MKILELSPLAVSALFEPVRGGGGFQSFITSMRAAVDQETRELRVSEATWLRIKRYAEHAHGSGGFQGRMRAVLQGVRAIREEAERAHRPGECVACWSSLKPGEIERCAGCKSGRTGPVFDSRDGKRVATFVCVGHIPPGPRAHEKFTRGNSRATDERAVPYGDRETVRGRALTEA